MGNVQGGKYKKGAKIIAFNCANNKGNVDQNMKFEVTRGKIRCKASPKWCITLPKAKARVQLVLDRCGSKKKLQDIQLFDDMTMGFTKNIALGFNVNGGIGSRDKIQNRAIQSYKVDAANNEAFVMRSSAPPTPKPTPVPTPPSFVWAEKGKRMGYSQGLPKRKRLHYRHQHWGALCCQPELSQKVSSRAVVSCENEKDEGSEDRKVCDGKIF